MRNDQTMNALHHEEIEEYLTAFNAVGYSSVLLEARKKAERDYVPVVSSNVFALLSFLSGLKHPHNILELGTGYGISTAAMLANAPEAAVLSVDIKKERQEQANVFLQELGVSDRCEMITADFRSKEFIETLKGKTFDMVFIDAAKGQFELLLDALLPFVAQGGLIVFDNVFINGWVLSCSWPNHRQKTAVIRMQEFLQNVARDERVERLLLPLDDGNLILKKK